MPRFTVVDHVPFRPPLEVYPYPKAGDPNPRVRLGVAKAAGGGIAWIDPGLYGHDEILIVDVAVLARRRCLVPGPGSPADLPSTCTGPTPLPAKSERILREESHAWVNVLGPPRFLDRRPETPETARRDTGLSATGEAGNGQEGDVANAENGRLPGRLPLAERTDRLPAPLPLRQERQAGPAAHRRSMGSADPSMPSTRRLASPTFPAPTGPRNRRRRAPGGARRRGGDALLTEAAGIHRANFPDDRPRQRTGSPRRAICTRRLR